MPIQPIPTADTSSPPLPNVRFCIVLLLLSWPEDAYPSYFASHPKPQSPRDLPTHHCINFRHGSAGVYHWEFDKGRKSLSVAVNGQFTVDDVDILIRAAVDGVGLAFALEEHVATQLAKGTLVRVLEDWCPPIAGYFLYYPSRRQQAPALSALIEALRL